MTNHTVGADPCVRPSNENNCAHDKAVAIAARLRSIRIEVIVTAEDILLRCRNSRELDFYYRGLCKNV